MIRYLSHCGGRFAKRFLVRSHDRRSVRSYLVLALEHQLAHDPSGENHFDQVHDLRIACEICREIGISFSGNPPAADAARIELPDFGNHRSDGAVIRKGRLLPGVAMRMEIESQTLPPETLAGDMERLLRHVEVRRRCCLESSDDTLSKAHVELDKQRIAIAFLVFFEKTNDLRFLNAAMKLNDWSINRNRRIRPIPSITKLIRALSIQERCLLSIEL